MSCRDLFLLVLSLSLPVTAASGQEKVIKHESAAVEIQGVLESGGIEAAWEKFEAMRPEEEQFQFDEMEFKNLGYRYIGMGKIKLAVEVFKMSVARFPESADAHDCIGEGYVFLGDKAKATWHYNRSLELNPANWTARMNLERMNGYIKDAQNETREINAYAQGENTGLQGAYLGQDPPGPTPEVFAPGIISTRGHYEFHLIVSPDGKEIYLGRRGSEMMVCRWQEDGWLAPEPTRLSVDYGAFEPHFSWDGKKLFFGSGPRILMVERAGEGWGEPSEVVPGMYATTTLDGTLYVTDLTTDLPYGAIARSEIVGGKYAKPGRVEGGLNMPHGSAHPCIAPDESFILFDALIPGEEAGMDRVDLFVCFREDDGSWSEAVNLGPEINTPGGNICATLSPDGKYMFYLANRDIYWVSTEVIERLRPE